LMTDEAELAEAYRKLNVYFMQEQPALPLSFLPEQFYEFSDANWTNWPTEANPYAPPQLPWGAAASKILWELKSTKK
jgi:peptide/nickel transport system substrate-binding protein